jgi:thiol-disulfide isomerase/thioredoxin
VIDVEIFLTVLTSTIFRYFPEKLEQILNLSACISFGKSMKVWIVVFFVTISVTVFAQNAKIVKIADVLNVIEGKSDQIQIVNFWATWCAPCVKELPAFEKLNAGNPEYKVTLVSLDLDLDPDPTKVYRFIKKKELKSDVLLLDEKDPNSWIDKISPEWSGALPATLVVNKKTGKRKFVERSLSEADLEKLISEIQ